MGAIEQFDHAAVLDAADVNSSFGENKTWGVQPGSFSCSLSNAEYHAQNEFLSHTGMLKLLRSPAHYLAYVTQSPASKTTPNIGSAVHSAWLEPAEFSSQYVKWDGGVRKSKAWDSFCAQNPGKVALSEVEWVKVLGMVDALRKFPDFPLESAFRIGEAEKSIFWIDQEQGSPARIRADCLTPCVIFDLKTFTDARPEEVAKQIVRMGYDVQAAMYTEGVRAFTGRELPFIFVFVEESNPHGVWVYTAGETILALGRKKFRKGLRAYAQVRETGNYPCYQGAMTTLELPRYAMREIDDSEGE